MRRILSLLIVAVLLLLLPADILALGVSGEQSEPTRVRQLEELRETNSDTYLLSDGRYECVVYAEDKYYKDGNGNFAEIDHGIVKAQQTRSGKRYDYKNAAGGVDVYFSSNTPSVYIEANGKSIAFSMLEARCINGANPGGSSEKRSVSAYALYGENFIAYENVLADTDVIYQMMNGSLKEYILLKTPSAPSEFAFLFDAKDLIARKTEAGIIEFASPSGEEVFELGSLFAVDSNGEYTEALEYTVEETGKTGEYRITVSLSADYLKAPERAFPVLVDPSVMVTGASLTCDSFVSQKFPQNKYFNSTFLCTGKTSDYGVTRSYISFEIPSNIRKETITTAYINVRKSSGAAPSVKAYKVTGEWNSNEICWANKPLYASNTGVGPATHTSNNWYRLYITNFVKQWCNNPSSNYGVALCATDESNTSQSTKFYSSEAASPNKPELVIVFDASSYGGNWYANLYFGTGANDTEIESVRVAVENALHNNGYYGNTYKSEPRPQNNITLDGVKNELRSKTIFTCITHGTSTSIKLPKYQTPSGSTSEASFTVSDLATVNASEMSQLAFVYFGACSTGANVPNGMNLVEAMRAKGVDAVLGFNHSVNVLETNLWSQLLMIRIASGYSVKQAIAYADDWIDSAMNAAYPTTTNHHTTASQYRYLLGNWNIIPCP